MDLDKIISDNIGLVYQQLHKFNRAYDDDAFCFALEALSNAAKTFDSSKNVAFSTYASVCIYNAVACYLRESARQAKTPVVHFDDPIGEDIRLGDTISTDTTPEDDYLKKELYANLWKNFDAIMSEVTNGTTRKIIEIWKDSDFMASQTDIARAVGTTQSNVSRAISAFKHKLKLRMEEYLCEK